ncbi:T9SS type A sorting domain-containing protein [Niastella caeni]|uniref:T9SS type A sorting domain-containing protein n=2 Tax=Niastella caeni TaxID=2569763 RepID=A0A4S8HVA5_9BACT|nr:T9SS type A sorting domain-containing protein [Niastella caeni]
MKKNYFTTLTLLSCLIAGSSIAQPICGFDGVHKHKLNTDPQYRKQIMETESQLQTIIKEQESRKAANPSTLRVEGTQATLYTIPVVVHVIHTGGAVGTTYNPSDAQITGAISYLNQVFAGTYAGMEPTGSDAAGEIQVQFALATRGPNCTATTGIDRVDGSSITGYTANGVNASTALGASDAAVKNFCRWDPSSYYNIYVVNKIDGADGTAGQFIAGYAYFPGVYPNLDGTVMLATQFMTGRKTLPHEIGHALNLYHPFEGSSDNTVCPTNTTCASEGDRVCDTDPISYNQSGGVVDFTCRTGTNTCTGTSYSIRTERNFMNYTNCFTLFTPGQKTRMLAAMSLNSRSSYATSYALATSYPGTTFTAPAAATCSPVTASAGLNSGTAGLANVTINNKAYNTGITANDNSFGYTTGYVDRANSCTNLISMAAGGTIPFTFTLHGANREQVRIYIDFNNDGDFADANESVFHATDINNTGINMTYSNSFTVPSTGITTDAPLRLRVIEEVSTVYGGGFTISSPCYNPTYGQAEDYPAFIISGALPVTLEYFKGEKVNKTNRLTWKTASEQNAKEFVIERSYNGNDFTQIGTTAASNKATGSSYAYNDNNYAGQVIYYRLKQVDQDGQYKHSGLVTIQSETARESVVAILNNPFTEKFDISISTPEQSKVVVNILDVTGKLLYTKTVNTLTNSVMTVTPDTKTFVAGMYFVQVDINGKKIVKKVIKK